MPSLIEGKWIAAFVGVLQRCGVRPGEACCVLSETQSRAVLVDTARLALEQLGATVFELRVPTPPVHTPVPVRSTGASLALVRQDAAVQALSRCALVVDCTVEGIQHAAQLPAILCAGARVLVVSNEHPEILERCAPRTEDEAPVRDAMKRLKAARRMRITSRAGTDLTVDLAGSRVGGVWGFTSKPGTLTHWPGGLVLAFPAAGTVHGTLVLDRGDVNLAFKRYLGDPVRLSIADDHVTDVGGESVDAELMRQQFAVWGDRSACAVSHVGWGLNERARWDAMAFYDKADFNGTELRAFAGNFLYSTGANEVAGRHTAGHFDLPLRRCTIELDGRAVVREGVLA